MDAIKGVEEAERAETEAIELEPQISEYELAKTAHDLLPPLEDLNRRAINLRDELKHAIKLKEEAATHLAASNNSKRKLKELEAAISSLNHNKSKEAQFKTYGLVGIISGLILVIASVIQPLFAILGIINLIAGVLLYRMSNPAQFDPKITTLKGKSIDLLRVQQRIREYAHSLERARQVEKAVLDELARVEADVHEIICLLPTKPSDYAAVFKSGGLQNLRQKITDDLRTLARLNTKRKAAQKIFGEHDQCLYVLRVFEEAFRGYSDGLQSIKKNNHVSNEAGSYSREEEAIRSEIDEASIPATASYPA